METLIYSMMVIALIYWTGYFWYLAGRWVYLHGRHARQRIIRLKDAAVAAYQEEDLSGGANHG